MYSLAARKLKYKNWFQPIVLFQEYCVLLIRHACIMYLISKPSLKIGTANAICWNSLGLFRDCSLNYIFLGKKTFLFFKIESWNFPHLFEKEFRETSQNFNSFSLFRQLLFSFFISVEILWGFTKFYFKQMLKVSAFYLEKQKSFIPKKNIF